MVRWRRGSRRRSWWVLLGGFSTLLASRPLAAAPNAVPPQLLPIEARWCIRKTVCIDLEVADEPEEQRLGLMQRPVLPPHAGHVVLLCATSAVEVLDASLPCPA